MFSIINFCNFSGALDASFIDLIGKIIPGLIRKFKKSEKISDERKSQARFVDY